MKATASTTVLTVTVLLLVSVCSTVQSDSGQSGDGTTTQTAGIDLAQFVDGALAEDAVTTGCTLASGTETSCYELTVAGFPANRDAIGPWCPATTSDSAAGIWFDGDAGPVNLCVYGEIEWADGGGPTTTTVEIPVTPTKADSPTAVGTVMGVTLDGFGIHAPYAVDAEAAANLDECNGHETAELGYHYHANQVAENAVLSCFSGETTTSAGAGGGPGGGGPPGGGQKRLNTAPRESWDAITASWTAGIRSTSR